ncbi:MAG: hypothetical protein R3E79_14780 [Caldilineaceae bacterium]
MDYVQKNNFIWLNPSLDPHKLYIQRDETSLAGEFPVITDLGFAELLLDNPLYANGAPFDVQGTVEQLAILLVCLLLGNLDLHAADWRDPTAVEARVNDIWQRHTDLPRGLGRALRFALVGTPDNRYQDVGEFAEALEKLAPPVMPRPPVPAPPKTLVSAASAAPPTPVTRQSKYQLKIYDNHQRNELKSIELSEKVITAGMSSADGVKLERLAAQRLYFVQQNGRMGDRYTVTDTGNGSTHAQHLALLDGVSLSPYYAALFPEQSRLTIAGYEIQIVPTLAPVATHPPQPTPPLQVSVRDLAGQPGERLTFGVRIQNQTREVDRFWLVLDGAPTEWRILLPPARQLFDGEEVEAQVAIRLPNVQESTAQVHPLILRLISENLTAQIAAVNLQIELLPAYDFVGMLTPETLRAGSVGAFSVENHGNLSRIFRLTWRDQAKALVFDPSETTVMVRAGESGEVFYRAYPRQWRWIGREKIHTISVLAAPQGGGIAQTYTGQVISRALIPAWAPPVVLLLVIGFFLVIALLLKPEFAQRTAGPEDVVVAGTPVTLSWLPINSCFYSVYEDGVVRRQLNWQPGQGRYVVDNPKPDSVIEVRIRNCLFSAERAWEIKVVTPTPVPFAPPKIVTFAIASSRPITPPLDILLGQEGDLCFRWEVTGVLKTLQVEPPVAALTESNALSKPMAQQCIPIANTLINEEGKTFKLVAIGMNEQRVESAPIDVNVVRARCYVNTLDPIAMYEGPDRAFPIRGYLKRDDDFPLFVSARPFTFFEQNDQEKWVQVTLATDPRPGWLLFSYLYCPHEIDVLPIVAAVPPTPTPLPTLTPTPTLTPLPTATPPPPPLVSLAPEIINLGGCALLKWEIQNVKEVYLNEDGVVGVAEREVCPTEAGRFTYTWRIVQLDGNTLMLERKLLVNPGFCI